MKKNNKTFPDNQKAIDIACQKFSKVFGAPNPPAKSEPLCKNEVTADTLRKFRAQVGGGWFANRFLYLFGEELETLKPCLDAWSFVARGGAAGHTIIGRNAYGALLVMKDDNPAQHVFVLDPFRISYWANYGLTLTEAVGNSLCAPGLLTEFLDDRAYQAWTKENNVVLEMEDALGFKVPQNLGGLIANDNLQLDGIVKYYQETGLIYADALNKLNNQPCEINLLGNEFEANYRMPCDVKTANCDGSTETGLVHRMPGFQVTFSCRACFEEKIRSGVWLLK
jgi:hypothetical protein